MAQLVATPFDAAKYFTTGEGVIELLNDALKSGQRLNVAQAA